MLRHVLHTSAPVRRRRLLLAGTATAVVAALAAVTAFVLIRGTGDDDTAGPSGPVHAEVQRMALAGGERVLLAMAAGTAEGRWLDPAAGPCRRCLAGPGLAAAAIAAETGDPGMLRMATDVFDRTLAAGWDEDAGVLRAGVEGGPDIETAFFAGSLGLATVLLGDRLDAAHRERWTGVVTRSADFLSRNGNLTWYTNGNINLANGVALLAAHRLSGNSVYREQYEAAMRFLVAPPEQRWPGRGLVVTRQPSGDDAGAGYLTEEGGKGPGYDPEYSLLQLDMLLQMDLIGGGGDEPRRLANLLVNQLLPLLDERTWKVDLRNGSRHAGPDRIWDLRTAAIPYLAVRGRDDLRPIAATGTAAMMRQFEGQVNYWNPGSQFAAGPLFAALVA